MPRALDIRKFFRRAPHDWLARYFDRNGLLTDFDWSSIGKRKIDALLEQWHGLDHEQRVRAAEDFLNIQLLATPGCKVQIIDEAAHFGEHGEVANKLLELGDFYACAFWVFLERPDLWGGALRYALADGKSKTYWRRRINRPKLGREPVRSDADALADALTKLFTKMEARGAKCAVHPYRRGGDRRREYYFAYVEDHRHTPLVFDDADELVARPHNPAFDIIFIHDDEEQTLSIWHQGNMERVKDLQVAFADAVLGAKIQRDSPRDDRAYDLQAFLDSEFTFKPNSMHGIANVELRKLRVRIGGSNGRTVLIDLNNDTPSHVIHRDLAALLATVPKSQQKVTLAGLRVTFDELPGQKRQLTRSFEIAAPNSCNLKVDDFSPAIERLLADHGLVPRRPSSKVDDDGR